MLDKILEDYKVYMKSNKKAEKTIDSYVTHIKGFLEFISDKCEYNKLTVAITDEYKTYLSEEYKERTINLKISAVKSFYKYLVRIGSVDIDKNATSYMESVKEPTPIVKFLNVEQSKELLRYVENDVCSPDRPRNIALIYLVVHAGLRVSEIRKLKKFDINFDDMYVHIYNTKGSKNRKVYVEQDVLDNIQNYFDFRNDDSEFAFVTNRRKQFSANQGIQDIVDKYLAKIERSDLSIHDLRKTSAILMKKKGLTIDEVSQQLGHKGIQTTLDHYWNIDGDDIKEKVQKRL